MVLAAVTGACASPRAGDSGSSGHADAAEVGGPAVERPATPPPEDGAGPASAPGTDAAADAAPRPPNPALPHRLVVEVEGDGVIESDDGSIECPFRCIVEFAQPRRLTLKAVDGPTGNFSAWTDSCTGSQGCAVDVNGQLLVRAQFRPVIAWKTPIADVWDLAVAGDDVYVVGTFKGRAVIGNREVTSVGTTDAFIARFDVAGQLHWLKTLGGGGLAGAYGVTAVPGDQVVVTGGLYAMSLDASGRVVPRQPGESHPFTVWYSRAGDVRRVLTDVGADAIASDEQGNVAIGSVPAAKYSPSGSKLWETGNVSGTGDLRAKKMVFDRTGNLISAYTTMVPVTVGGVTHTPRGFGDVIVFKYSPSGTLAWSVLFGQQTDESMTGLAVDANGDVYLSGIIFDKHDSFVASLAGADGSVRWTRVFDRPGDDRAGDVVADSAGNLFMANRTEQVVDIGGGVKSPGSAVLRLEARTGSPLSAKRTEVVPWHMALHASGDLLGGAAMELARLTVR